MTEAIGRGGAPLPPKRPTIIRPQMVSADADGGAAATPRPPPTRPAPPQPSRPAPPQVKKPAHLEADGDGDTVPRRTIPQTGSSTTIQRGGASVKKRPEITILGARPMSQVGFRNEIQTTETEHHTPPPTTKPPDIPTMRERPPRPVSMGRPGSRPAANEDNIPPQVPSQPSVPSHDSSSLRPPRPSRPKSLGSDAVEFSSGIQAKKSPDNGTDSKITPPVRPPRSAITPSEPLLIDFEDSLEKRPDEDRKQPPRPSRPTIIRPKRPQRITESSGTQASAAGDGEDCVQDGGALVVPLRPLVRPHVSDQDSSNTVSDNSDSIEPLYAVINKNRPPSVSKPKISPREEKVSCETSTDGSPGDNHDLPFKVKLRSTVVRKTENEHSEDTGSQNKASKNRSSETCPPPLAAKPKPLPKPKPASKPQKQDSWADKIKDFDSLGPSPKNTRRNGVQNIRKTEFGSMVSRKDSESDDSNRDICSIKKDTDAGGTGKDAEIEDYEKGNSSLMFSEKIVVKRPTIIRPPPKPARVSQNDNSDVKSTNGQSNTPAADGSDDSRGGPPLPAKRPISQTSTFTDQALKAETMHKSEMSGKRDDIKQTGRSCDVSGKSKPEPPVPARRPVSQTAAIFNQSAEDNNKSEKSQELRTNDAVIYTEIDDLVPGNVKNQGPTRPSNVPLPRMRKSPSDNAEQKSSTEKQIPKSEEEVSISSEENQSTCDKEQPKQPPSRPAGRPPPPKFSTVTRTVTKTVTTEKVVIESTKPGRPSSGPPRPTAPPSPKPASNRGRPSPPKASEVKETLQVPELPTRPGPGHPLYHYMMNEPHGIAQFDYTASHNDEISFTSGETVLLVRRVDANWLVGTAGERTGIFPAEFVHIVRPLDSEMTDEACAQFVESPESTPSSSPAKTSVTSGPRCIARFDFEGEGKEDLSFEEDDVIRLISTMGCDWMRGELNGKEGIFPIAFVDIIEPLPDDAYRPDSFFITMETDYIGKDEEELSFKAGDTIKLLGRFDSEWLIGETNTREGKFPASLVTSPLPPELPDYEPPTDLIQEQETRDEHKSSDDTDSGGQPIATALHDFEGEQEGDLSFQEGDRIELLEHVGKDWYKGRVRGNVGIFPATFAHINVDLPEKPAELSTPDSKASDSTGYTESNSSGYSAPDSSGYSAPDVSGYSAPDHLLPVNIEGRALFDFEGERSEELTFKKGDVIILGEHISADSDWQYGILNGKRGMFPASFVEII